MGKIYKADFGDEEQKTKTIQELFESIQLYRSQGKSLPSIHAAFQRSGLWNKSRSSFLKSYYQYRNSEKKSNSEVARSATSSQHVSTQCEDSSTVDAPSLSTEVKTQGDTRTGIKPDMTLEEKREISARLFKQRNK